MKKGIVISMLLLCVFVLSSCAASQITESSELQESDMQKEAPAEKSDDSDEDVEVVEASDMTEDSDQMMDNVMKEYTMEELSKYNGKDGNPAYVAYEGKVYDVSEIKAWMNGVHQGQLEAGKDYTEVLNTKAPHPPTNLTNNAPIVGIYKE